MPAGIARYRLRVPATRPESFDTAAASRSYQVIIDLEDAVDPSNMPAARVHLVEWPSSGGKRPVRINEHSSGHGQYRVRRCERRTKTSDLSGDFH